MIRRQALCLLSGIPCLLQGKLTAFPQHHFPAPVFPETGGLADHNLEAAVVFHFIALGYMKENKFSLRHRIRQPKDMPSPRQPAYVFCPAAKPFLHLLSQLLPVPARKGPAENHRHGFIIIDTALRPKTGTGSLQIAVAHPLLRHHFLGKGIKNPPKKGYYQNCQRQKRHQNFPHPVKNLGIFSLLQLHSHQRIYREQNPQGQDQPEIGSLRHLCESAQRKSCLPRPIFYCLHRQPRRCQCGQNV